MGHLISDGEKRILTSYLAKIQDLLEKNGSTTHLVSLKILYPRDSQASHLRQILILANGVDKELYVNNLDEKFIKDGTDEIKRTLTFLKYSESIKYSRFDSTDKRSDLEYKSNPFEFYEGDDVPITGDFSEFKNPLNLETWWEDWGRCIQSEFPYGKSTLWSYIVLRIREIDELIASAYLIFSDDVEPQTRILINKFCQDLLLQVIGRQYYLEIWTNATRAAISQVMARNTSHNIGAHVMNKLTNPNFLETFCSYSDCLNSYKPSNDFLGSELENHKPLYQLAIFNNYVKCRMDYLADIALGTPLMQTNKWAFNELFKDFDKVRLLLEHLSGLSQFKYRIEFKKNGEPLNDKNDLLVAIPNDILGIQAFYNILENIIRNTAKHSKNKPTLTVFTVNFIDEYDKKRNGNNESEIKNILNEFIAVEVFDNIPIDGNCRELTEEECIEYKNKTKNEITRFETRIDELVFTQNLKLNEDILKENKLRASALGLVEMDASAAYLRKRDVSFINHTSYDIEYNEYWSRDTELNGGKQEIRGTNCRHFLKAFKTVQKVSAEFEKVENGEYFLYMKTGHALGYRFFLHRPAIALVVTDKSVENKDSLKKLGIWVVPPFKSLDEKEKDESFETHLISGKVYNHDFVVIDKNVKFDKFSDQEFLEHFKTSLPVRVVSTINDLSECLNNSAYEIEKRCWLESVKNEPEILIRNSHSTYSSKFQAVFLDHLYSSDGTLGETAKGKSTWEENRRANYVEALSSLAQSKMPDFYALSHDNCTHQTTALEKFKCYIGKLNSDGFTKFKVKESVLNKVIVIDERVQEAAENRDFMGVPFKCLYRKMNVIVPVKESLNLSANNLSDIELNIERYILNKIKNSNSKDFILIHYSILERIYKKWEINTKLEEWAKSINVVITSGRGIPEGLTDKSRFVNLSSVITTIIDLRCKFTINCLLFSSRKSNKI